VSPERFSEEELVERPAIGLLAELGWETANAYEEVLGAGGTLGRDSRREAILVHRLRDALNFLNPRIPRDAIEEAITAVARDRSAMDPTRANREVYDLLRDGYLATWRDETGNEQAERVHYLDWHDSQKNDWLAANQVWLAGDLYVRRADLVLFVNGLPLVLMATPRI
jgi:type I restriction enzyme R subunit